MDLEELVRGNYRALTPVAKAVAASQTFDLQLPCALLTESGTVETTVGQLRNHLPYSVALASEPFERFLTLCDTAGFDAAFEQCSSDDATGEEFCRAWDDAQADLEDGDVLVTLNDLVAFVNQARQGWSEHPRQFLVVAVKGTAVTSGLVRCGDLWALS